MENRQKAVAAVYYGGLSTLMALIVTKTLPDLLSGSVAHHVASDSEGYVLALLLPLWIGQARLRLVGRPMRGVVTAVSAAACLGVAILLYNSRTLPSTVKTLNETFFALALLIPYVQMTRRPPMLVAAGAAAGVLGLIVAAEHSSLAAVTTNLAEGTVMLILAPLAFDLADRGILQPDHPSPTRWRQLWWTALAVLPVAFIVLRHAHLPTPLLVADRYATRAQEAFVGMLLVQLYFAAAKPGPRRSTRRQRLPSSLA